MQRRTFLGGLLATPCIMNVSLAADSIPSRIIDTHQHLWDLNRIRLPWLNGAPDILKKRWDLEEYREATQGLPVEAIYMEVDVHDEDLDKEVSYVVRASQERKPTRGAVIGGDQGLRDSPITSNGTKDMLKSKACGEYCTPMRHRQAPAVKLLSSKIFSDWERSAGASICACVPRN